MSALRDIAKRGVVSLLHGAPGSLQSHVAHEIAFRCARAGHRVVVLDDDDVLGRLACWRNARSVQIGERLRLDHIEDRSLKEARDLGVALVAELGLRKIEPDVVISTRLVHDMGGIDGRLGGAYLQAARDLTRLYGAAVIVAGHCGAVPGAKPSVTDADLWRCVAGLNLQVTLTGPRGEIIDLKGKEHGGSALRTSLIFEEPEHV
jgi:hypothetical protein